MLDMNNTEKQAVSARTRRHRDRHRTVADLDMRSRAGRRAVELMRQFEAELGGDLTAGQRLAVSRAGVMTAIAEDARVRVLNGVAMINYDDLVRLDRVAALAVQKLGIHAAPPKSAGPSLGAALRRLEAGS